MNRFLLKISLFSLLVVLADISIGHYLKYVTNRIKVGGQGRDNYISNEAKDDILVLGSSRAVHHYNSKMLEDTLGLSCYNCGQDGAGIILSYGRLLMIKERHQPKMVIVDVNPSYDLLTNDNHKYLGWLKLHYDKQVLHPIFNSVDETERIKMISYLYRYNSKFIQNLYVFFTGNAHDGGVKGFRPQKGNIDKMKIKELDEKPVYEYDSLKIEYIHKLIKESVSMKLFFVVSPIWYGMDTLQFQPVKEICSEKGIPFIDFSNNPKYVHQDKWFKDGVHMNERGADEFTRDLVKLLR